ncbi:MAG: chromosome segregation protein SMC [Nitrososphaeraceae archaeon]|nr:chromosome segregation protein SMC [Nitrososphaeraceae archaeon]
MVFIKKLEIYGFKSFGFKNTILNFNDGLIAVTGPNGSGKSNVLDAIMFSLGENSPKALRVDKFQSLFHDTYGRANKLVRVSITFDNKDRGIPVNADHVTLTREIEGNAGDSQYYLNGKRVNKSTLTELLQVVVAIPAKINIVQQGMITRISELNSEERRKIIEDIVGLSYFDDKKEESIKQLEESDRRLAIALARMGEIRKRIDELEIERNEQLRFEHIEASLKKYKATKISHEIQQIENGLASNFSELRLKKNISKGLHDELETTRTKIEKLDGEKLEFIKKIDSINKQKAEINNETSRLVYEVEKLKAIHKETVYRIAEIQSKLEAIAFATKDLEQKVHELNKAIHLIKEKIQGINNKKYFYIEQLKTINTNILNENERLFKVNRIKEKFENRNSKILNLSRKIEIDLFTNEEKLKINIQKDNEIKHKINSLQFNIDTSSNQTKNVQNILSKQTKELLNITNLKSNLQINLKQYYKEIENSSSTLEESDKESLKIEEKNFILTNSMPEDLTISEILKNSELEIIGVVHDLIKWDKDYHRCVVSIAKDWMKAIVVKNVENMIKVAEFAKYKKLPRVRIIPLDLIHYSQIGLPKEENIGIIGNLSNFVSSEFDSLVKFLFGNIIVVRTVKDAYMLSLKGYKTVSMDGELFEPESKSLLIDYNSTIVNVVKEINLENDIKQLRDLILKLKSYLDNKVIYYNNITKFDNELENIKNKLENSINYNQKMIKIYENQIISSQVELNRQKEILDFSKVNNKSILETIEYNKKRFLRLSETRKVIQDMLLKFSNKSKERQLSDLNINRTKMQSLIDSDNQEIQDNTILLTTQQNERNLVLERKLLLNEEKINLERELIDKESSVISDQRRREEDETILNKLRNQEQEIINSYGNSYSILQTYESHIKELLDNERKKSKEYNSLEREIVLLEKECSNLEEHQNKLNNDLIWLGYKKSIDEISNIEEIITELSQEYDLLKSKINLRANENYIQVIEGYRGMSERKNDLEKERNSIVLFIDRINQEKENMFMDAFLKVNQDINSTFSSVVGGNSWLELENQEDIFSAGVRLIVQFPGKPRRESTSLSGGEKTMAATIFLLALQAIKPSPFYLMDEIDAHLDAENTDRLSRILEERAQKNQIIMVTLKDSTISRVDQIFGVYPKNGVSQILKYKYPKRAESNKIPV